MRESIRRRANHRTLVAVLLAAAASACGDGGAILPTEADSGAVGEEDGAFAEPPGEGGGDGGVGGDPQPASVTITVDDEGFHPVSVTVSPGTMVRWAVMDGRHDVTFLDHAPAGGSIPETREDEPAVSRTFAVPGVYRYECARHADDGETGEVVVQETVGDGDDPSDPPAATATVVTQGETFVAAIATIRAGGTVQWRITGSRHNVTFTGIAPPGGEIPNTDGQTVPREFPEAGRYDYFRTRHAGMTGAVVVQ